MKHYVKIFEEFINENKLKINNIGDIKETKKLIGIRNPGFGYSGLQKNMLLKRLKEFNQINGTKHSVDATQVGRADLYHIKFNFSDKN